MDKALDIVSNFEKGPLTFKHEGAMKAILLLQVHRVYDSSWRHTSVVRYHCRRQKIELTEEVDERIRTLIVCRRIAHMITGAPAYESPEPLYGIHHIDVMPAHLKKYLDIDCIYRFQTCVEAAEMIFADLKNLAASDKSIEECRELFEETIDIFSDLFLGRSPKNFNEYKKRRFGAQQPGHDQSLCSSS